jgi:hypothetical protein
MLANSPESVNKDCELRIRDPEKAVALPCHHRDLVSDNVDFA